jgi:hypothetical protein
MCGHVTKPIIDHRTAHQSIPETLHNRLTMDPASGSAYDLKLKDPFPVVTGCDGAVTNKTFDSLINKKTVEHFSTLVSARL